MHGATQPLGGGSGPSSWPAATHQAMSLMSSAVTQPTMLGKTVTLRCLLPCFLLEAQPLSLVYRCTELSSDKAKKVAEDPRGSELSSGPGLLVSFIHLETLLNGACSVPSLNILGRV